MKLSDISSLVQITKLWASYIDPEYNKLLQVKQIIEFRATNCQ